METVESYRQRVTCLIEGIRRTREVELSRLIDSPRPLVLAEDINAPVDVPHFDNSQMDGFAVSSTDWADSDGALALPERVPLQEMAPAGHSPAVLKPGHALPVMTGSRMPEGADCCIPVEETARGFDGEQTVEFTADAQAFPGRFVRSQGSDIARGTCVASTGSLLTPAVLGTLASVGATHARTLDPVRVAYVSTGDEVVRPGAPRSEAQIFDANLLAVCAALTQAGCQVVARLHVADDPGALLEAVGSLSSGPDSAVDLVVSSGGISKGAREVIRMAAELEAAQFDFVSVAMQPGGPQGLGTLAGLPWVALPGNPVSSLVSIEMFLRPALLGYAPEVPARLAVRAPVTLPEPISSPRGKLQVRRARLEGDGSVSLVGGPSSHLLTSYAGANALALIPEGVDTVDDGTALTVLVIDSFSPSSREGSAQ